MRRSLPSLCTLRRITNIQCTHCTSYSLVYTEACCIIVYVGVVWFSPQEAFSMLWLHQPLYRPLASAMAKLSDRNTHVIINLQKISTESCWEDGRTAEKTLPGSELNRIFSILQIFMCLQFRIKMLRMSSWFNTKSIIFTSSVTLQVKQDLYGGIKVNSNYDNVYFMTARLILLRSICIIGSRAVSYYL